MKITKRSNIAYCTVYGIYLSKQIPCLTRISKFISLIKHPFKAAFLKTAFICEVVIAYQRLNKFNRMLSTTLTTIIVTIGK